MRLWKDYSEVITETISIVIDYLCKRLKCKKVKTLTILGVNESDLPKYHPLFRNEARFPPGFDCLSPSLQLVLSLFPKLFTEIEIVKQKPVFPRFNPDAVENTLSSWFHV